MGTRAGVRRGWTAWATSRNTWRASGASASHRSSRSNITARSRWTMDTETMERSVWEPEVGSDQVEPVVRRLPPELTPLRALAAVERAPHTLFLESGGRDAGGARGAILALDPPGRL